MTGYNGEKQKTYSTVANAFTYEDSLKGLATRTDVSLAVALANDMIPEEARNEVIARLCEASALSGSVALRVHLAVAGGIKPSETEIITESAGRDGTHTTLGATLNIAMRALKALEYNNQDGFDLLCAAGGFYPFHPNDLSTAIKAIS